ncbi:uncharacterized protein C6orf62 homolog [Exaiptasia diaphana]|uniref:Uncharacterized protein n=1 Tax=Exaiptasia diaphana TaxID=2652724 RepID=A0A913Y4U6_EXADI|nr:uncharacterized protein C6orf62 homolog [Exaiptasia diaphana]KXJ28945.1 Uncharacterized protein C6orf62-like [Exaiptasia diaphana]
MPNTSQGNDACSRKETTVNRLREQLRRKREALADHFDYELYLAFIFKEKKKPALFKVAEVIPIMTNNYKDSIMKGVQENAYSLESSQELLDKDVVQLHATRYQSMRKDVPGCTQNVDFFLWPRNDIEKIVCHLFSRWKGDENAEFKLVQVPFDFNHSDYKKQLLHLIPRKASTGLIVSNPSQAFFLFVNRHRLQTPDNNSIYFSLSSFCLHVPQDLLTMWGPDTVDNTLLQYYQD